MDRSTCVRCRDPDRDSGGISQSDGDAIIGIRRNRCVGWAVEGDGADGAMDSRANGVMASLGAADHSPLDTAPQG